LPTTITPVGLELDPDTPVESINDSTDGKWIKKTQVNSGKWYRKLAINPH
jgi:hypothetical protein